MSAWTPPTDAQSAVWAGRKFISNPTFGYVHEAWARNAGAPPWASAIALGSRANLPRGWVSPAFVPSAAWDRAPVIPLVMPDAQPAEDKRAVTIAAAYQIAAAAVYPMALPYWSYVGDIRPWPVWALPQRNALQRALVAAGVGQVTDRGYKPVPIAVPVPIARPVPRPLPVPLPVPVARPVDKPVAVVISVSPTGVERRRVTLVPAVPATFSPRPNEIKTRAYPIVANLMHAVVGLPTEVNDMLQAMHDALPRDCRHAGNSRRARQDRAIRKSGGFNAKYKRVRQDSAAMARDIASCIGRMDLPQAVTNLVDEALADRASHAPLAGPSRGFGMPVESILNKRPGQDRIVQSRPKPRASFSYRLQGDRTERVRYFAGGK